MKTCPRCFLETLHDEDVLNAVSHDGKEVICSTCGRIESLERLNPALAMALKMGQRQVQAARYGLDKNRNPRLPMIDKK